MQTRQWQDQEGQTRSSTEVIANDMIMLDSRRDVPSADDHDMAPEPVAVSARPAVAAKSVAAAPQPGAAKKATSPKAAKIAPLPRGKGTFQEEDLPF